MGLNFLDEHGTNPSHPIILHNSPSGAVETCNLCSYLEKAAKDAKEGT